MYVSYDTLEVQPLHSSILPSLWVCFRRLSQPSFLLPVSSPTQAETLTKKFSEDKPILITPTVKVFNHVSGILSKLAGLWNNIGDVRLGSMSFDLLLGLRSHMNSFVVTLQSLKKSMVSKLPARLTLNSSRNRTVGIESSERIPNSEADNPKGSQASLFDRTF